jgi:hypothetical protein
MTQPTEMPPVDPGNPFVMAMELPSIIVATPVQSSNGPRLLVTIRCGSATLTVPLAKEDAQKWGAYLSAAAGQVSSLIVAPAGQVPPPGALNGVLNGHGR